MRFLLLISLCLLGLPLWAQISDDFSDGNFSANPAWSGSTSLFQISAAQELQSNGLVAPDTLYLSTPNTQIANTEWRFRVKLGFAPSSTSFARIYLVSDQADLTQALNGYYIRVGTTGTSDSLELFKQTGTVHAKIAGGVAGNVATNPDVRVKVTRDNAGNWAVFSDVTGGTSFSPEMTVIDNTFASTAYFGYYCRYSTLTYNTKYYLDDVYVGNQIVDITAPTLLSASVISNTEVDVLFDEALDITTSQNTANYNVNNGVGTPITATLDGSNAALVHLVFGTGFPTNTFTLSVLGVKDLNNNAISPAQTANFSYVATSPATFKDLIFNEILADPLPQIGLPNAEFVELYNRSTKTIDLTGWQLSDGTTNGTLSNYIISPFTYVILTSTANAALFSGNVIGVTNFPSLNNTGDNLTLKNTTSLLIDSVAYSSAWFNDAIKADGGWTLELISPNPACLSALNWGACTDPIGGTPAAQNSIYSTAPDITPPTIDTYESSSADTILVCFNEAMNPVMLTNTANYSLSPTLSITSATLVGTEDKCVQLVLANAMNQGITYTLTISNVKDCSGNSISSPINLNFSTPLPISFKDLIINEIFADPSPIVGLPNAEFIELYNKSTQAVNLNGWRISDGSSNGTIGNFVLNAGEYITLTSTSNVALFSGNVVGVVSFPSLNNGGDNLGLRSADNVLIDSVNYLLSWYNDAVKDDGGWSLELINPTSTCVSSGNWTASTNATGGTPGAQNSVFSSAPDVTAPTIASTELIASDTIRICYSEGMDLIDISTETKYAIAGVSIAAILVEMPENRCVKLILSTPVSAGNIYNLTISNVKDCAGNNATSLSTQVAQGLIPQPFDVLITEIFTDYTPVVGLPEAEFIEIYNRTNKVLDIANWNITDASGTAAAWDNATLMPNEYAIVCSQANAALFTQYGKVIAVPTMPSLNNDTDSLYLNDANNLLVDYVFYADEWYRDEVKKQGGWTLERVDVSFYNCNNPLNWTASTNSIGGTPGAQNSVAGSFSDTDAPDIIGLEIISPTELRLYFSEQMRNPELVNGANYFVDNGIGSPILVVAQQPGLTQASLIFLNALNDTTLYTLAVNDLADCSGNLMTQNLLFGRPDTMRNGDIVLSEVLFNPYTGGADFIEVYNKSDKVLDLRDLKLAEMLPNFDNTQDSIFNVYQVTETQVLLLPHQYICLTADVAFQQATYSPPANAQFFEMASFPSYDDTKGGFVLLTASDTLDKLYYDDEDYHFPTFREGVSWERTWNLPFDATRNEWYSAASINKYATPGYANYYAGNIADIKGAILLNEILFNPVTGGVDYVEIYNNTANTINLASLRMAKTEKGDTTWQTISPIFGENDSLLAGELLCLTTKVSLQQNTYLPPSTAAFMEMKTMPTFEDTEGEVLIFNEKDVMLDRFYYKDDYHFPALKDKNGVALERISLTNATANADNWHSAASTVNYGTPGYENSVRAELQGGDEAVSLEYDVFTPNGDGEKDVLAINYKFDIAGGNARVFIYDSQGVLVKNVVNNILIGPEAGTVFWDGTNNNGERALIGLYVVVFEFQNMDSGKKQAFKKACTLGDKM